MTKWTGLLAIIIFIAWYFFSYENSAVFNDTVAVEETVDTVDMGVWSETK